MRPEGLYLGDIVEATRDIQYYLRDATRVRWGTESMLRDAVLWRLMNIGEAACHVSSETQAQAPEVPWKRIKGFRNIAAHGYFALDTDIVWEITQDDLPVLGQRILALLKETSPELAERLDSAVAPPEQP